MFALVLWFAHACSNARAFQRGVASARAASAALVEESASARREAEALLAIAHADVDTVFVRVKDKAASVRDLGARVHDTVRVAFPVVDTLVLESAVLAAHVDTLKAVVQTERAAAHALHVVDTMAIHALAMVIVAERDTIETLKRRPTRKLANFAVFLAGGIGYLVGGR